MMAESLSGEQLSSFQKNGYLILRNLLDASEVHDLQEWAQEVHDWEPTSQSTFMPYEVFNPYRSSHCRTKFSPALLGSQCAQRACPLPNRKLRGLPFGLCQPAQRRSTPANTRAVGGGANASLQRENKLQIAREWRLRSPHRFYSLHSCQKYQTPHHSPSCGCNTHAEWRA